MQRPRRAIARTTGAGRDRILRGLRRHGLTPVLTLVGTPAWANSGRGPQYAPPRPRDFRGFATAIARRYPWVQRWLIWNEPNKPLSLEADQGEHLRPASAQPRLRGDPRRAAARPSRRRRDRAEGGGGRRLAGCVGARGCGQPAQSWTRTLTTRTGRTRPRHPPAAAARTARGSRWRRSRSF